MQEKIIEIIAGTVDTDASAITTDTTMEDLGLDSLDLADLMMNLEDEFGVTLELSEQARTVGDLIALIEAAGGQK